MSTDSTTPDALISKEQHIRSLARELIDDIELDRLPTPALVLKTVRLARLVEDAQTVQWLEFEMMGYTASDDISLQYMSLTGRWIDQKSKTAYWGPLAQQEADLTAARLRLQTLRTPDVTMSVSSANPHEYVGLTTSSLRGDPVTAAISSVLNESRVLGLQISHTSAIISRVRALLHHFVIRIYHAKAFGALAESLFERHKSSIDTLLAKQCPDALQKVPTIYARLAENDPEAISQALTTCRRIIDAFADAVFPPESTPIIIDGSTLDVGPQNHLNRLKAYISQRISSKSRRTKLNQSLRNLYGRCSSGVHSDVSPTEAQALFLETYLTLGEILMP